MNKNNIYGTSEILPPEFILTGNRNNINDLIKFYKFIAPRLNYIPKKTLMEKLPEDSKKILYALMTERERFDKILKELSENTKKIITENFYDMIGRNKGKGSFYNLYWLTTIKKLEYKNWYKNAVTMQKQSLETDNREKEEYEISNIQAKIRDDEKFFGEDNEKIFGKTFEEDDEEKPKYIYKSYMDPKLDFLKVHYNISKLKEEIQNRSRTYDKEKSEIEAIKLVNKKINIINPDNVDYEALKRLQNNIMMMGAIVEEKEQPQQDMLRDVLDISVQKDEEKQDDEGAGAGIIYNTYEMITKGSRKQLPPSIRNFINQYGNKQIIYMKICKKPISNFYDAAINITSFGQWNKNKKIMNYDKMAHLYIVFSFGDNIYYRLEKNHVIDISVYSREYDETCMVVDLENIYITFSELINNAYNKHGLKYIYYDAIKANCQIFVAQTLESSKLLTTDLNNYIMQDVEKVLTPYINTIMYPFINIAYRLDTLLHGDGVESLN